MFVQKFDTEKFAVSPGVTPVPHGAFESHPCFDDPFILVGIETVDRVEIAMLLICAAPEGGKSRDWADSICIIHHVVGTGATGYPGAARCTGSTKSIGIKGLPLVTSVSRRTSIVVAPIDIRFVSIGTVSVGVVIQRSIVSEVANRGKVFFCRSSPVPCVVISKCGIWLRLAVCIILALTN